MNFFIFLKNKYRYTDYEIKLIRYTLSTIISELSKFIILGILFALFFDFQYYSYSIFLLLFLRRYSGGYHCKTYISCLIFSFTYIFLSTLVMPQLCLPLLVKLLLLILATVIINLISPIPSTYHRNLSQYQIIRYRIYINIFLIIHIFLMLKFSNNQLTIIGYWEIIIHTFQLTIEYIKRRRCPK